MNDSSKKSPVDDFIESVQNDINFLEKSRDSIFEIISNNETLANDETIQKKLYRLNDSIDKYKCKLKMFLNEHDIF